MPLSVSKSRIERLPATNPDKKLVPDKIHGLLFPPTFRVFRYRHWILNTLRAVHILCLCPLVGGVFFGQDVSALSPWLIGTLVSGLGIFVIDLYGSCIALFEIRGLSVLIKLGLIGLLPFLTQGNQLLLLTFLIFASSLLSHGRHSLRHKSFMSRTFQEHYGFRD